MKRVKRRATTVVDPDASRMLRDFAEPLVELIGGERAIGFAVVIWNAVTIEAWADREGAIEEVVRLIDELPTPARETARDLLGARLYEYDDVDWAFADARVRVREGELVVETGVRRGGGRAG
jgi:hypothetical protein